MADKISISPSELEAQSARLASLSDRMERVRSQVESIGNTAYEASSGGVGYTHRLIRDRIGKSATVLKMGADLAAEAARSFQNVDAVIRSHVEGDLNDPLDKFCRENIPDSVMKKPVSQQKVQDPDYAKWEQLSQSSPGTKIDDVDFGQGAEWGGNYKTIFNGVPIYGSGCFAMAHMMSVKEDGATGWNVAYGEYPSGYKPGERMDGGLDPSVLQPGDVVLYYRTTPDGTIKKVIGSDKQEYPDQHWVYVYAVQGDTLYIGEGNAWDGKNQQRVNYRTYDTNLFGDGKERRLIAVHRPA